MKSKQLSRLILGATAFLCCIAANAQTVLIWEDFSDGIPTDPALPDVERWTTLGDGISEYSWIGINPENVPPPLWTIDFDFETMDDFYALTQGDDIMTTPGFDCSTIEHVFLRCSVAYGAGAFDSDGYQVISGIDLKVDGGNWTTVYERIWTGPSFAWSETNVELEISEYAAGRSKVNVRFRFSNTVDGFFAVDNVLITEEQPPPQIEHAFERLWPSLKQPWYFNSPRDLAQSPSGEIYVADTGFHRVLKLSEDGKLIAQWGGQGSEVGRFNRPTSVAVAPDGTVFVADALNDRIQRFSDGGEFELAIPHDFGGIYQVAQNVYRTKAGLVGVAPSGHLYATSFLGFSSTLSKYDPDGNPISIDFSGSGGFIEGLAFDESNNIYIGSWEWEGGILVTKLDSDGQFLAQIDSGSTVSIEPDGNVLSLASGGLTRYSPMLDPVPLAQFPSINGRNLLALSNGQIVVSRAGDDFAFRPDNTLIVYESDGSLAQRWAANGTDAGYFKWPSGIAVHETSSDSPLTRVYVADTDNFRIQVFTPVGTFLDALELTFPPEDLALDSADNIYVVNASSYPAGPEVFKLSPDGSETLATIPGGSAVATDTADNVYILSDEQVLKYDSSGDLLAVFGVQGSQDLAVDELFNIYVLDHWGDCVHVYDSAGAPVSSHFTDEPFGLDVGVVDGQRRIYVYERHQVRILDTMTGEVIGTIGELGNNAGQFFHSLPGEFGRRLEDSAGIAVDDDGNVYVVDDGNHRVQKFRPFNPSSFAKAVVVAAGGPYEGNNLWSATQANANFAYRALAYQGYTKETIYYLSSDTDLDLDNNGEADDVDADCTLENLRVALEEWAPADVGGLPTEDVVVYVINHGGVDTVRLNETELLKAETLDGWLSTLESEISGTLTVVYDACESGTFMDNLGGGPAVKSTTTPRVVLTSTSPGESAHFVTQGSISFSSYFWEGVFNGASIADSFTQTLSALMAALPQTSHQTPMLDDTGNGVANEATDGVLSSGIFIGNGTVLFSSAPVIDSFVGPQDISGTSTASLWADPVTDTDEVSRVWAVLRPPDFVLSDSENPLSGLPTVDLIDVGNNRYEAEYTEFTTPGTYTVLIYATDALGNTSKPKLTSVSVDNPLSKRAVILAGGNESHPDWPGIDASAAKAYEALRFQGYAPEDVYYMRPSFTPGFDATPTLDNLAFALDPGQHTNTQDLLVYLVGPSADGGIVLSTGEILDGDTLDCLLDDLQGVDCNADLETTEIDGKVTVVYDAAESTAFLSKVLPPAGKKSDRILVGSTNEGQQAQYLSNGRISFSNFFWVRVLNGADTFGAYSHARGAMRLAGRGQLAILDDTGDGISNVLDDGPVSRKHTIGTGVLLAGDDPIIGSITMPEGSGKALSVSLEASDITSTGIIDRVWGVVAGPGNNIVTVELNKSAEGEYSSSYNGFDKYGSYTVAVYATDTDGNTSVPKTLEVTNETGEDIYEPDNTASQASWIGVARPDTLFQSHNFHEIGDVDWVAFDAVAGDLVEIEAFNVGDTANVRARLYERDGTTLILEDSTGLDGTGGAYIPFFVPADGRYLVEVVNLLGTAGEGAHYDLRVFKPEGPCGKSLGISISVEDSGGDELADVTVRVVNPDGDEIDAETDSDGNALFSGMEIEGEYTIQVEAPVGYLEAESFTIDLFCVSDEKGQTVPRLVVLTEVEPTPILQVTPVQNVSAIGMNDVEFEIVNSGTGVMPWEATVLSESEDWIEIVSDASDPGDSDDQWLILVDVEKNASPHPRNGWLRIEAPGATGSPREVYVHQDGDTMPPIINIKGANPLTLKRNTPYSDLGATALDDVVGDLTSSITTSSTVDTSKAGTYFVSYSVADAAGNTATVSRTVFVLEDALSIRMNHILMLVLAIAAVAYGIRKYQSSPAI